MKEATPEPVAPVQWGGRGLQGQAVAGAVGVKEATSKPPLYHLCCQLCDGL